MVALLRGVVWVTLLVVSGGFAGVGVRTYREKPFPGRNSITAYCLLLAVTLLGFSALSVVVFVKSQPGIPGSPVALELLESSLRITILATGLLAPLAWLRFVLVYTGQRIPTTRRMLLVVGFPVLLTIGSLLVFFAFKLLPLVYDVTRLPPGVVLAVVGGVNYLLSVSGFYLGALLVAGASLVAWTSYTYRHLSTRGGTLLAVGCLLPWAAMAVPATAGLFEGTLGLATHVAAGGVLGAGAVGAAIVREDVFEQIPAAGSVGRDVTVESMNDPVVVVDQDRRVVDLNPAAERLFGVSIDALGGPLTGIVGDAVDVEALLGKGRQEFDLPDSGRVIEATGSRLEDEYGRTLGHSVVFHDVTDRKRRQQRIQVLNRVLRHNLRNELTVVRGHAEALGAMEMDLEGHPERIQGTADRLLDVGAKAREIETVLAAEAGKTKPLSTVLDRAVADARAAYPDCTFRIEKPATTVTVEATVLEAVVGELVTNAAEHNDADAPLVVVGATVGDAGTRPLELTVTDNGPGIPEHELAPIREGRETDLEHGSGLGLWLVKWGVATVDGQLGFDPNEPTGTIVTIRLPLRR